MEDHRLPGVGMLTSWKEIASFFHRDVRTVQRWEREEGLPVHRHPHQRRSSVYAYHEELEKWWARYQEVGEPPPVEAPAAIVTPPRKLNRRRATLRWAVVGAVISVAGLGAASLFLYGGSNSAGFPLIDVARLTNTSALDVKSLDDLDGDGRGDIVVQPIGGRDTLLYLGASRSAARSRPDVRITVDDTGHVSGGVVGDVDGDGLADLVVSSFLNEPATYSATGSSYLVKGRREWPDALRLPRDADTEFHVDFSGDIRMGPCAAPGGVDLNADGLRDVVIGGGDYSPPGRPSAGAVFVLFGRQSWPKRIEVVSAADVTIHGSRSGDALRALCATGDFTADVSAGSLSRDLDPATLRLAGVAPTRIVWQDFDGDGKPDLRLYFDVTSLSLRADTTRLALRGRTRGGLPVAGSDDVVVAGNPTTSVPTNGASSSSQRDK